MCEIVVDACLHRDWYVTHEMLEILHNATIFKSDMLNDNLDDVERDGDLDEKKDDHLDAELDDSDFVRFNT